MRKSPFISLISVGKSETVKLSSKAEAIVERAGDSGGKVVIASVMATVLLSACGQSDMNAMQMPTEMELSAAKAAAGNYSVPAFASKEDCENAAKADLKANNDDVPFTCEQPSTANTLVNNGTTSTTTSHSSGGGMNPWIYYWMGRSMNGNSVYSGPNVAQASFSRPRPTAFLNVDAAGSSSFAQTPAYNMATPSHLAGMGHLGGTKGTAAAAKTGYSSIVSSKMSAYNASRSSVSSVHGSSGRSFGGHGFSSGG